MNIKLSTFLSTIALTACTLAAAPAFAQAGGPPPGGGPGGPGGPGAAGPGAPGGGMRARSEAMIKAAEQASKTDPAKWDWPAATSEDVKRSIIDGGYTSDELRNIFIVLAMQSGNRWPAGPGVAAPPPIMMNPNDSRPFGTPGTMPAMGDNPLYAPDIKLGGRGFRGLEQVYGSNGYLMNSFTDRKNTVVYIIAKKNKLYYAFDFEAKHTGKLFGFPGNGKTLKIRETATMTFTPEGKIASIDMVGDDLSLYLQAGGQLSFPKD